MSCCICLEELDNFKTTLDCSHEFHSNCILPWNKINNGCPLCRKNNLKEPLSDYEFLNEKLPYELDKEIENNFIKTPGLGMYGIRANHFVKIRKVLDDWVINNFKPLCNYTYSSQSFAGTKFTKNIIFDDFSENIGDFLDCFFLFTEKEKSFIISKVYEHRNKKKEKCTIL
jgi:hypothetical protein